MSVLLRRAFLSHYFYIKRTWLISPAARRIWRACAWLSLLLLACPFLYAFYADWLYDHQSLGLLNLLLLISVIALAGNVAAMEYYLFTLDDSRALAQIFWFVAFFLAPVGPAIYCLVVYSRSKYFKTETAESLKTISAQQP